MSNIISVLIRLNQFWCDSSFNNSIDIARKFMRSAFVVVFFLSLWTIYLSLRCPHLLIEFYHFKVIHNVLMYLYNIWGKWHSNRSHHNLSHNDTITEKRNKKQKRTKKKTKRIRRNCSDIVFSLSRFPMRNLNVDHFCYLFNVH